MDEPPKTLRQLAQGPNPKGQQSLLSLVQKEKYHVNESKRFIGRSGGIHGQTE